MAFEMFFYYLTIVKLVFFVCLFHIVRAAFFVSILSLVLLGIRRKFERNGRFWLFQNPLLRYYLWGILFIGGFFGRTRLLPSDLAEHSRLAGIVYGAENSGIVQAVYILAFLWLVVRYMKKSYEMRRCIKSLPWYFDTDGTLQRAKEAVGGRQLFPVLAVVSAQEHSPFSFGLVRPVIVLPKDYGEKYSASELYYVFAHELLHIHSFDLWVNALLAFCRHLFWFVPFFSRIVRKIQEDMETACDYRTLALRGTDPYLYGMAIIRSLPNKQAVACPGCLPLVGAAEQARMRMQLLLSYQGLKTGILFGVRVLLILAIFSGSFLAKAYSYPPYEMLNEIYMTKDQLELEILLSKEQLSGIVWLDDKHLYIRGEALLGVMEENGVSEERVGFFVQFFKKEAENVVTSGGVTLDREEFVGKELIAIPFFSTWQSKAEHFILKHL